MHWKWTVVCFALCTAAFGGGLIIGNNENREPETVTMAAPGYIAATSTPHACSPTPVPLPSNTLKEETKYLLMLSGESICIYELLENGETELLQKTEINTGQLRQEDYEKLCRGITVESLEKAKILCEDFGN